jgi:hypothetical protein
MAKHLTVSTHPDNDHFYVHDGDRLVATCLTERRVQEVVTKYLSATCPQDSFLAAATVDWGPCTPINQNADRITLGRPDPELFTREPLPWDYTY